MAKEIYYKKVGNKYVPISEYDSDFCSSFQKGTHIVVCNLNSTSYTYCIDPEFAPLIAAGKYAENAIREALVESSKYYPRNQPITSKQKQAWDNLCEAFGNDMYTVHGPSTYDIAKAGINAMIKEAEKLLENPAVKNAYDQFMMLCKLTKETQCEN